MVDEFKTVSDFLKTTVNREKYVGAFAYLMGKNSSQSIIINQGGCHFNLKSIDDPIVLGTGFHVNSKKGDQARKIWDWISNPELSPWRVIIENGVQLVIHDDGLPCGVLVSKDALESVPFNFIKNFCILMRSVTEWNGYWDNWELLIDKYNFDPRDAFYLGSLLNRSTGKSYHLGCLNGTHHPLTDNCNEYVPVIRNFLNWERFYTGNIIPDEKVFSPNHQKINSFWFLTPEEYSKSSYRNFNGEDLTPTILKGRFGSVSHVSLEHIIKEFYKWKKKHGLPGKKS